MVQAWYDKGVFLYLMAGICGIGVLFKVILGWYLSRMVRNTEKMQKTRKKWLQKMQQDYQICAKEYGRVNNVDIFVDKYVGNRRFLGIMLSTWDKFGGQTALLCAGIAVVAAAAGVFYEVDREVVLFTFFVGIWLVIINMVVDNMASLPEKMEQAATNLKEYFINRMAGQEASAEDITALQRSGEVSSGAVPELALARVTENELEALLGGRADANGLDIDADGPNMAGTKEEAGPEKEEAADPEMEEEEAEALLRSHTLDAGMPGDAQKVQTHLYVINNEQESGQKAKGKAEKAKTKPDSLVDIKTAGTQKESRKEAAARKKREKAVRQAAAKKEIGKGRDAQIAEEAEDDGVLAETGEGLVLASLQTAAARQEEGVPVESLPVPDMPVPDREEAVPGLAAESRYPGNGQLIEDVLREFLV